MNVEYLTWPIIRYKREVLFGWVDLLVSFGGIAGLFLGFSLLSGVEIIYYFSLRACCMLYKNREELYELAELKLKEPLEFIDLSLTIMKRTKAVTKTDDDDMPGVRQIDVNEIGAHVANDESVVNNDTENQTRMPMPSQMTRLSKKPLTSQVSDNFKTYYDKFSLLKNLFQLNRLFTSLTVQTPPDSVASKSNNHKL